MSTKFFRVPFAQEGDVEEIPDALQASGAVSFTTGYGFDYERDPAADPSAKDIERSKTNWMFSAITDALRQYQTTGTYPFITAAENNGTAYPYIKGAQCLYQGAVYESLVDNNTALPTDAIKWRNKSEIVQDWLSNSVKLKTTAPLIGGGSLKDGLTIAVNEATENVAGVVVRASDTEAAAGADAARYVTPKHLGAAMSTVMPFVRGMIMMWSGAANAIPSGWALCNGQSGTPNLMDRFVIGAGNTYAPGATGGESTATTSTTGNHTHAITVGVTTLVEWHMPSHYHVAGYKYNGNVWGSGFVAIIPDANFPINPSSWTGGNGGHNHAGSAAATGNHAHTVTTLPPYYAICFIMKL